MLRLAAVVSILALASGQALAQEAIPTAQGATPPDASREPPPPPLGARPVDNLAPVQPGPCGLGPTQKLAPLDANGEPQVDTSPHGEITASVGNHGYREIGGAVCMPIGKNGSVSIDVGESQFDGRRR